MARDDRWRRAAHPTSSRPGRGVFDGVERLLHEVLDLFRRRVFGVAVVVAEAGIADPERVGAEVFAELEILVKPRPLLVQ
jgi:hypothetical protein